MQHRPLFSQANIDDVLRSELIISNQDAKLKILTNWKNGIVSGKIRSLNERKLQSEFLNKIFGDVLGYSYENQLTEWQLEHEYKVDFDGKTPTVCWVIFSLMRLPKQPGAMFMSLSN